MNLKALMMDSYAQMRKAIIAQNGQTLISTAILTKKERGLAALYLESKDGTRIVNLDNATDIHINGCDKGIYICFSNGRECFVGDYRTKEELAVAFEMLTKRISLNICKICAVPSDKEVRMKIISDATEAE